MEGDMYIKSKGSGQIQLYNLNVPRWLSLGGKEIKREINVRPLLAPAKYVFRLMFSLIGSAFLRLVFPR